MKSIAISAAPFGLAAATASALVSSSRVVCAVLLWPCSRRQRRRCSNCKSAASLCLSSWSAGDMRP